MGNEPINEGKNIYFRCRKEAAVYNDRLNSRAGAADLLGVSESSLSDYELGNTKVVPVDKVVLMADLYSAPEMENYYCSCECPIGKRKVRRLELANLDRLTLKILAAFQDVHKLESELIAIAADGNITETERPRLEQILASLDTISQHSAELRLWAEKNIKK